MTDTAPILLDETAPSNVVSTDDLSRADIENQLSTTGVLLPGWRERLVETTLFRIDGRMRSAGVSAIELNDLTSRRLKLLAEKEPPLVSPVPTYGRHPACSKTAHPTR